MIKIKDSKRWFDTLDFAEKTGQLPSLLNAIKIAFKSVGECDDFILTYDFAPYSFCFCVVNRCTCASTIQGGIIYHGPIEGQSCPETFSIEVSHSDGWHVHT